MTDLQFFILKANDEFVRLQLMVKFGSKPLEPQIEIVDNLFQKLIEGYNHTPIFLPEFQKIVDNFCPILVKSDIINFDKYLFSNN